MSTFAERPWSEKATLDDVYYCYRILLAREPSDEDIKYWSDRLATEEFSYDRLAWYFRKAREFGVRTRARGITLVSLDDFELYVHYYDWDIGENILQYRQYEPHVTAFLKKHLREGMTFVDVGANIGYFTLTAAKQVGFSGRVIAVECNPQNCELMYMSLHRNGFDQVSVYPFAVSDSRKLMSFSWGFSNGMVNELSEDEEEPCIIPAVTLDSLLQNESRIDVIKMDIEGSEGKAWTGMQQTIQKHYPILLMEFFPALLKQVSGGDGEDLLNSIFAQGYRAAILGLEQQLVPALSTQDVINVWRKRAEETGDEAKTYLDLVFSTTDLCKERPAPVIAWLSPFPPQRSGIANYSYSIIKELRPHLDIDLFYDGEEPAPEIRQEFNAYPISEFTKRRKQYDEVVYHLGNNSGFHKKIYELAWNFPGTIVLHDYNLSAFLRDAFYREGNGLYEQALLNDSSESERRIFRELLPVIGRHAVRTPMSHAVVNRSRKVIVHHRWMKNRFPDKDHIQVVPMFAKIDYQPTPAEVESFKSKFQIRENHFLISCLGFTNANKLPKLQIEVIERLLDEGYPVHLLFAGETAPEVKELEAQVAAGPNSDHITFTGYLNEKDYFSAIFASDVIVNLRNPSMGEASLTLMQALAAGKPTIISDVDQYKEFPDRVCWKVTHDENQAELLHEYLKVLLSNRNVREAISANSSAYVKSVLALERVIPQWLRVLRLRQNREI